jgi:copper homeostasis protein
MDCVELAFTVVKGLIVMPLNSPFKLEICCYSAESALVAQDAGADRIELCADASVGGITPSYAAIELASTKLNIALHIIIRPRGGDFLYSADEFTIMQRDIEICKNLKCDGVVIGILTAEGFVDVGRTRALVQLAKPMSVTFHRAFDMANDAAEALEVVIASGCDRLLTSGHRNSAVEGRDELKQLVTKASGRIVIMPGAGVCSANIVELVHHTGAIEFHSSARTMASSKMIYREPNVSVGSAVNDEYAHVSVNADEVRSMRAAIHGMAASDGKEVQP